MNTVKVDMDKLERLNHAHQRLYYSTLDALQTRPTDERQSKRSAIKRAASEWYADILACDREEVDALMVAALEFARSCPRDNPNSDFADLFAALMRLYTYAERKLGVFGDVETLPIDYAGEIRGGMTYCKNAGTYRHSALVGAKALGRFADPLVRHTTPCGIVYVQLKGEWYTPDGRWIYTKLIDDTIGRVKRTEHHARDAFAADSIDMLSETHLDSYLIHRPHFPPKRSS